VVADRKGRELFGNIERTGQEGLVAMGRMVRLLRDGDPERSTVVGGVDTIRRRVERFAESGTAATLEVAGGVDAAAWSPELAKSVERLVQEGLTNIRKHARSATAVRVVLEPDDDRLVVRVRDDGSRSGRVRFRPSGFGVLGLAERVSALGGDLTSGPLPGGGWQLRASIPVRQGESWR
jgi:signal transduction histidine kinase